MKYQLLKEINPNYSTLEQVLTNRNIPLEEIQHYLYTTDNDINEPELLGENLLKSAGIALVSHIQNNDRMLIIVDCDCDGFTSAALFANYLYDLVPSYTENRVDYYFHEGKEHGLSDCINYINDVGDYKFILVPDAGSNDFEYHKMLIAEGIDLVVLDHHLVEEPTTAAIVINNQNSDYPNKELSGVGVVWQFCRYLDKILDTNIANNYLDLVALGNTADMMSLTSIETKHLINKGFEPENIHNPYIYEMWQKNKFKLGEHINSIDAAFYIVPMINAVQRSGTLDEKELLFNSMLKFKAFNQILSNKRGHKLGEQERLVDQAVRMSTNVKNRQTRAQDAAMETLEKWIEEDNMLEHKALIFLLESGNIDKNIAGLIANKIANKYQRPCCILTKIEDPGYIVINNEEEEIYGSDNSIPLFQGSARGYELTGLNCFKDICDEAGAEWTAGHQNAFGLCVREKKIYQFIANIDIMLSNDIFSTEPIYYVDYIYKNNEVKPEDITVIASLKNLWGKDLNEPYIAIEDLRVSKDMVTVYNKTTNTLKITLPNKVTIMKFNATDEECDMLQNQDGYISMNIVGKCNLNEFMGNITPQIFIEDSEVLGQSKYIF